MPRAHGDVGAAEVEERLGQRGLVVRSQQSLEAGDVVVQRGLEGMVEQMLHCERLGEIGTGRLAHARPVVQVHRPGGDCHLFVGFRRHVLVLSLDALDREIVLGNRQAGLQQPLVDRSELPHRQRPEVHGAVAFVASVHQQGGERGCELVIGEAQPFQRGAGSAHGGVGREQAAVVRGYPPAFVATVHRMPELAYVVPHRRGRPVVGLPPRTAILGEAQRPPLQRMVLVVAVGAVGKQVLILGVGHEQQPEEDQHHLLVGVLQVFAGGLASNSGGDGRCQRRNRLVVDALAQPLRKIRCEPLAVAEDRVQSAVLDERLRREQQVQVPGQFGGQ